MIKFSRQVKQIMLLAVVVGALVLSLVSLHTTSANAWPNSEYTGREKLQDYFYTMESSKKDYVFNYGIPIEGKPGETTRTSSYGTHDWVADSAIRLIAMSPNEEYRKQVRWLLNYSYSNPMMVLSTKIWINGGKIVREKLDKKEIFIENGMLLAHIRVVKIVGLRAMM